MAQLWKSDLNAGLQQQLHKFNRSLDIDFKLWKYDIQGSLGHVHMLYHSGLLNELLYKKLTKGLQELSEEIAQGKHTPLQSDEDIHGFIERLMVEKVGPEGSNIHLGRSRNEQVLLDVTLFLKEAAISASAGIKKCISFMKKLSKKSNELCMPSFTHLQRAQPIFVSQYCEAHIAMWERTLLSLQHYQQRLEVECPMGAGAINGTTFSTQPALEASYHGFQKSSVNSLATVSMRHNITEFISIMNQWVLDLSRLMEDFILWNSQEFSYVEFSKQVTTGSSMMPHKRNPDICELIRGQSSRTHGALTGCLFLLKNLSMGYMKDLQEDKRFLFEVWEATENCLEALPILLDNMSWNQAELDAAVSDPLLLATDIMEWIVECEGKPMREAHHIMAGLVNSATVQGENLLDVTQKAYPKFPANEFTVKKSCKKRMKKKLNQFNRELYRV